MSPKSSTDITFLARSSLQHLLAALQCANYRCLGPQARAGAIVYDDIQHVDQLPQGLRDHQAPGSYRLEPSDEPFWFGWANGAQAIKPQVFSPREVLWQVERNEQGLHFRPHLPATQPMAIIGVRACDLAALKLMDQHFLHGQQVDAHYQQRRQPLFLVAVNCIRASANCFCASTGDGPEVKQDFDLLLSEIEEGFIAQAGTAAGEAILQSLPTEAVTLVQQQRAGELMAQARQMQTRTLNADATRQAITRHLDSAVWHKVSETCLSCANCTAVCPTCFCSAEQDQGDLNLQQSEHVREWDSCFTLGHSYIHGQQVRSDTRQQYRQWAVHKLSTWFDQYGRSGCVGCGRCISWCPVGIDITAVAAQLVADESA